MEELLVVRIFILGIIQAILNGEITKKTLLEVELPNVSHNKNNILKLLRSIDGVKSAEFNEKSTRSSINICVNLSEKSFSLEIQKYCVRVTPT